MQQPEKRPRPAPRASAPPEKPSAHATDRPLANTLVPSLRGIVNAIAAFESKTVERVHEELGQLMGRPGSYIDKLKSGEALPRDQETLVLVAAASRRADVNRRRGRLLIQAARYGGDQQALLDEFWPEQPDHSDLPAQIAHNLSAPLYTHFVMRSASFAEVLFALQQRCALVVIVSLGGMGKTSLAREVAEQCFSTPGQITAGRAAPQFQAVVWVSDKDHPGRTTLERVLDTIAVTLGYPSWTRFDHKRKRDEIKNLCRSHRVLLVVDNFETITDDSLLEWMIDLPEKSKALITSREYRPEFRRGTWPIDLSGMSELEARQFIADRGLQYGVDSHLAPEERDILIRFSGGNPQIIDMILGIQRHTDQPIVQIIDRISVSPAHALDELLATSWAALQDPGRRVLLALALFTTSVRDDMLAVVAAMDEPTFFEAIAELKALALIETERAAQRESSAPVRRSLHPLTRQFIVRQQPEHAPFIQAARQRWLAWAASYADSFGFLFNDLTKLQAIDAEEPLLRQAIDEALLQRQDALIVRIAKGIEYYYYIRALWGPKLELHLRYMEAAQRLGNVDEEIAARAMHIQLLSRQGHPGAAAAFLPRLRQLAQTPAIGGESVFHSYHAHGLHALASGDLTSAEQCWRQILSSAPRLQLPVHMEIGAQHWLANCLVRQGNPSAARALYQAALTQARERGYDRTIARNQIHLALLDLDDMCLPSARERLQESAAKTNPADWEQLAWLRRTTGLLHAHDGDTAAANAALHEAIVLFERMGLADEIAAAQRDLDTLSV